jgi:hypothetical protein
VRTHARASVVGGGRGRLHPYHLTHKGWSGRPWIRLAARPVQSGVPLNTVRDLLGHGSLAMTLRYAHLAPDQRRDAVTKLNQKPVLALTVRLSEELGKDRKNLVEREGLEPSTPAL